MSESRVNAMWRSLRFHELTDAAVHLLVVLLGVAHDERVLLGEELLVFGEPAVPSEVQLGPSPQLDRAG